MDDLFDTIFGQGLQYDPCEALKLLRPALMRMVAGQGEQKINFRDRDLWLHPGSISELKALVGQLEKECAQAQGVTLKPKRFAAVAGHIPRKGGSTG
jgi:hypothetical protein